jgi:thymidylate synthase
MERKYMVNAPITADTFARVYTEAISMCYNSPTFVTSPRGLKIKELVNQTLVLEDPTSNLFKSAFRSPDLRYLAGELIWYLAGQNNLDYILEFSKFWKNIANEDNTVNSAYGHLLFAEEQIRWPLDSLKKDKDSRQAIFHINQPKHQRDGIKDFPCTLFGQFMIRNDELHLFVTMRSNDFWFGLTYDLPFFTILQQSMLMELQKTYPELKLGKYVHTAMSLHIYEKDFKAVESFLDESNHVFSESIPLFETNPILYDEKIITMSSEIDELYDTGIYCGSDPFYIWLATCANMEK